MIADHLSRLEKPIEVGRGTEIEENFPDEQLSQVSIQVPWYADVIPKYVITQISDTATKKLFSPQ